MLDGSGALQGVICLFTDLSTVVDLEEQLRLKDSLSRLGELTAGLAHEFRNGLATIHGDSRLLDFEKLPDGYLPYVQGIRQETDSPRQVVDNQNQCQDAGDETERISNRIGVGGGDRLVLHSRLPECQLDLFLTDIVNNRRLADRRR